MAHYSIDFMKSAVKYYLHLWNFQMNTQIKFYKKKNIIN